MWWLPWVSSSMDEKVERLWAFVSGCSGSFFLAFARWGVLILHGAEGI
jgi:hypothetical protein